MWLNEARTAEIEIAPCADPARGPFCGRVVRLLRADAPTLDEHNADPGLRDRKLMHGFRPAEEPGSYEDGAIYNAEDGKTYRATLRLSPDGTPSVRGYVGTPLFGRSQVWTRLP